MMTRKTKTLMARTKRDDAAVKLDAAIVKMARYVAVDRDTTIAAYLSEMIRPQVEADYLEMTKRLSKQGMPKPGGSR